jgi:predicted lipid-binding transport protein (Tim44 family)
MPKPPSWLPWLGPPLAGVGAGLAGQLLGADFWGSLIAALVVGFVPIIVYRLWKWRHHRRG